MWTLMFELLFKYPASLFHKGQFVFLTPWPLWLLAIAILCRRRAPVLARAPAITECSAACGPWPSGCWKPAWWR